MARKALTLKQARHAALQGRADEAVSGLRIYADQGDSSASASLAELLAFKGEWNECLQRAGELIANPQSVYASNVFDDMIRLLGRAGQETRQWDTVLHVTQVAEERTQEAPRNRFGRIFQALRAYAEREGNPPHELIRVFGATGPTQAEQDYAYPSAVQNILEKMPGLRDKPDALMRHRFALAKTFHQEADGVRLFDEGLMPADFDCAVFVAKACVHCELSDRAWDVLWKHMRLWWRVDRAQVAPVVLLVDRDLASLMSHERCEKVLALPRGSEAQD